MTFTTTTRVIAALLILTLAACKKDFKTSQAEQPETGPLKMLNQKEKETVAKFEHASLVLQGLFSNNPAIRKEFNGFIAAKLAKSGTDEELTFKEIFEAKPINLTGVKSDFLYRFREAFAGTFLSGKYPGSLNYKNLHFKTSEDVAAYFEIRTQLTRTANSTLNQRVFTEDGIPYEIYFPYSENWDPLAEMSYAVSYHPLTNMEWNYGRFYNAQGTLLNEVTVDDEYAYETPTYIITYDDGLKVEDFRNGTLPVDAATYSIGLTDDEYNPFTFQKTTTIPNPSPCTQELRVKDGRWTLLRNGYGIFEGKIEYAVSVTVNVSEVSVPTQNPQSNPIIQVNRTGHAFGYQKIKRRKIKDMRRDVSKFISFGLNVSPWCAQQPDKMIFLYEYDKPNIFSENALEWSQLLAQGANLVGDSTNREQINNFANQGLAPLVKVLLEGTAKSKIEHYSIIGSNAVWANQRVPTNGTYPPLLNGFRPYGKNEVMATLVID
jgi:hypothetical protein